jgi:hypothetical protein
VQRRHGTEVGGGEAKRERGSMQLACDKALEHVSDRDRCLAAYRKHTHHSCPRPSTPACRRRRCTSRQCERHSQTPWAAPPGELLPRRGREPRRQGVRVRARAQRACRCPDDRDRLLPQRAPRAACAPRARRARAQWRAA